MKDIKFISNQNRFEFINQYRDIVLQWYRNSDEVNSTPDFVIGYREGRVSLAIPEVFAEDAGTFSCEASNNAGSARSSAQLVVKATLQRPQFLEPLKSQSVIEGAPVRLIVRLSSKPPATGTPLIIYQIMYIFSNNRASN